MTKIERLVIQLQAKQEIYQDSSNYQATYGDIAGIIEIILQILDSKECKGFKEGE